MFGESELFILFGRGLCYLGLGVYSVLLAIFWGPAFVLRNVLRSCREIGVDSWPRANGFVTNPKVNAVHGWILDYALGQVEYTYRVHGEYYAGTMIRQFPDEQVAWNFVDAHREEPVVVRYRDDKPEVSILLLPDQGPGWILNSGSGFLAQVWQHMRDELRLLVGSSPSRSPRFPSLRPRSTIRSDEIHRAQGTISPFNNDDFK